ncbi:hypothetical protein D3C76_881340 [compost metagenome]
MANQVDLVGSGFPADALDDRQQLFAAHFAGVERRDLHREDLGTTTPQGPRNAEPVGIKQQANKPEHAGHQHQRVASRERLGHVVPSLIRTLTEH